MPYDIFIPKDFASALFRTIPQRKTRIPEDACPICKKDFGSKPDGGDKVYTTLGLLTELPFAGQSELEDDGTVEPVSLPCGHTFCLYCICHWLLIVNSCPTCRDRLMIPDPHVDETTEPSWLDQQAQQSQSELVEIYRVQPDIAATAVRIAYLHPRAVLATALPDKASFIWHSDHLSSDLSRVMVLVAARFFGQQSGRRNVSLETTPPRNPLDCSLSEEPQPYQSLDDAYLEGKDGQRLIEFLRSSDRRDLFEIMCSSITAYANSLAFKDESRCTNVSDAIAFLVQSAKYSIPDANGGLKRRRWWTYVQIVVEYLLKWQYYCQQVEDMLPEDFADRRNVW